MPSGTLHGTLALENGASIKAVAARLGHAQLSTTNIYLHGLQSADAAIADSFETLLDTHKTGDRIIGKLRETFGKLFPQKASIQRLFVSPIETLEKSP